MVRSNGARFKLAASLQTIKKINELENFGYRIYSNIFTRMETLYTLIVDGRTYLSTSITEINSFAIKNNLLGYVEQVGTLNCPLSLSVVNPTLRCNACGWIGDITKPVMPGNISDRVIDTCPTCGGHNFNDL
jgi:hypothetical protein